MATTKFQVAGRPDEICVVPNHLAGVDYEKDDADDEAKLCAYNFYAASPGKPVAICPKLESTNPGVDVHALKPGLDQAQTQSAICGSLDRGVKKIAKYKQSISCSYTPSILGYYHVSRALGGVGDVKTAVLRTMDLEKHKQVTAQGQKFTKSGDLINTLWNQYARTEAKPAGFPDIFTSDQKQIFGALQKNPNDESRYGEINGRLESFVATSAFKRVTNGAPIGAMVGRDKLADFAQVVVQMKDISDMILMDYILSQQDRFGNIHYVDYTYFVDPATKEIKKYKKESVDSGEKTLPPGAAGVTVKEMLLKDNDCGVIKDNKARINGLLSKVAHMSPKTYAKFRAFSKSFQTDPSVAKFFMTELMFSARDVATVKTNLKDAEAIVVSRCKAGQLLLDADVKQHFKRENITNLKERCGE